jgi:hypothetical protein
MSIGVNVVSEGKHDDVFIVTSVITPTTKPLCYNPIRSFYTPEERADQTLKTIVSIREHHPNNCKIVVVELGLDKKIAFDTLARDSDTILYLGNVFWVRWACDTKYKGLGEAIGLLAASSYLKDKGSYFYKVSGRYYLTHDYNMLLWNQKLFNFKRYNADISTRLYGFPIEYFTCWQKALAKAIPLLMLGKQIETALPKYILKEHVNYIDQLGIEGHVGPDGFLLNE